MNDARIWLRPIRMTSDFPLADRHPARIHRLSEGAGPPAGSASVTTAKAAAAASGPAAPRAVTAQMISSAVCAVTILTFLTAAARLAVTANTAGSGWRPACVALRIVTP